MHRADADAAWEAAATLAENAMRGLEAQGLVPVDVLPNSDEALAKAALHQVALLALGPTNKRTKMQALKILLDFSNAKPDKHATTRITTVEEWLEAVAAAAEAERTRDVQQGGRLLLLNPPPRQVKGYMAQ